MGTLKHAVLFLVVVISMCETRMDNPIFSDPVRDRSTDPVKFQVRTETYNGKYSTKNIGAVWIEDENQNFIKTLRVWSKTRRKHLVQWNSKSGGEIIDAVTSATKKIHQIRTASWNLTNSDNDTLGKAKYKILVEFTEENSKSNGKAGKLLSVDFYFSDTTEVITFDDQPFFKDIELLIH